VRSARRATRSHQSEALVLRRVNLGEADLVVHLLTESMGRVSAVARSARKSQKRFGGALEVFHTLRVRLEEREDKELMTLQESTIAIARRQIVSDLDRMQAAGRVLGWVRRAAPPRVREPAIWSTVVSLLDALESTTAAPQVTCQLAQAGLRLLAACGWGLELDQCVVCGRTCASGKAAYVDANRGGLVCRSCGGARTRLSGSQRQRFRAAAMGGACALESDDARSALELVEEAMRAHLGFD
jgi:DNA repair protein RecO (recombination protein O)